MKTNSTDFAYLPGGATKNSITGKTIHEMTWDEIISLVSKPMTQAEAMKQMEAVRIAQKKGQSS